MPFQGLILIRQVVPKLWPFIYQTNDRTRCYDITIDVTIVLFLFFARTATHVRPLTYGHARTATHVRPRTYGHARAKERPVWLLFLARDLKVFFIFNFCTYGHARTATREQRNSLCGCCFWHAVESFFGFFCTYGHPLRSEDEH